MVKHSKFAVFCVAASLVAPVGCAEDSDGNGDEASDEVAVDDKDEPTADSDSPTDDRADDSDDSSDDSGSSGDEGADASDTSNANDHADNTADAGASETKTGSDDAGLTADAAAPDDDAVATDDSATDDNTTDEAENKAYVLMTQVYTADSRTVYFALSDSLELDGDRMDITQALEFPQVANMAAIGVEVFVSNGESSRITKFEVSDDLEWKERETISFEAYPLDDNANWYYQFVLSPERVVFPIEVTNHLLWNPKTMEIEDQFVADQLEPEIDGLLLGAGANGTGIRFDAGHPFVQAFPTVNANDEYGAVTYVALFDDDLKQTETLEVPCPGTDNITRAEDGTIYLGSNWASPIRALYEDGNMAPCVARLTPDGEFDTEWTNDLTQWTDGRYAMNFRYLSDGKAIANVIHHEELDADFDSGEYDVSLEDKLWESSGVIKAWLFDLEAGSAAPISGIDMPLTPRLNNAVIDGRNFVFVVDTEYESTTVYEIHDDATATVMFEAPGEFSNWQRIR